MMSTDEIRRLAENNAITNCCGELYATLKTQHLSSQ